MTNSTLELKNKVAIIGIGSSKVSYGIITNLLEQGATVVVPAQSSQHLKLLQQHLGGFNTDKLITLLTDLPDYDKATDLAEMILEQYGPFDLVVFPFDQISVTDSLSNISVADWQRAVEENLTVYFICSRVAINAMKKRREGMFVAIIDTDGLLQQKNNAMTDILMTGQVKMARNFFEEVKNTGIKFRHLFINNLSGEQTLSEPITPDSIGQYIISLYKDDKESRQSPFLFFIGKDFPDMQQYFKNN